MSNMNLNESVFGKVNLTGKRENVLLRAPDRSTLLGDDTDPGDIDPNSAISSRLKRDVYGRDEFIKALKGKIERTRGVSAPLVVNLVIERNRRLGIVVNHLGGVGFRPPKKNIGDPPETAPGNLVPYEVYTAHESTLTWPSPELPVHHM
jgi:hypothetical protein